MPWKKLNHFLWLDNFSKPAIIEGKFKSHVTAGS